MDQKLLEKMVASYAMNKYDIDRFNDIFNDIAEGEAEMNHYMYGDGNEVFDVDDERPGPPMNGMEDEVSIIEMNESSPLDISHVTLSHETAPELPRNTHLYFDEDGNVISREEFLENQEEHWAFKTPTIKSRVIMRHPRVLLNFLRFIDSCNEEASDGEEIIIKKIPYHMTEKMLNHSSIINPAQEFINDVNELKARLYNHTE